MKKNELKTLEIEELKSMSGGVAPGPDVKAVRNMGCRIS